MTFSLPFLDGAGTIATLPFLNLCPLDSISTSATLLDTFLSLDDPASLLERRCIGTATTTFESDALRPLPVLDLLVRDAAITSSPSE